jgi:hypothetical protein
MDLIHADLVGDDLIRRPAERRRAAAEQAGIAAQLSRQVRTERRAARTERAGHRAWTVALLVRRLRALVAPH